MLSTHSRLDPVIRVVQSYGKLARKRHFPSVDKKAETWRDWSARRRDWPPGVQAGASASRSSTFSSVHPSA